MSTKQKITITVTPSKEYVPQPPVPAGKDVVVGPDGAFQCDNDVEILATVKNLLRAAGYQV